MPAKYTKLTARNIRSLHPGESITENAITVRRTKNGDLHYSVNFMVDGVRVHRVIGLANKDGVTRSDAERFIQMKRAEALEGRLQLPKGRKTHICFNKAADLYLEREEETGGRNLKEKTRMLKRHLKPFFKDMRLDKISEFTLGKYKKHRLGQGAAPGTVNHELKTLSHLFTRAASPAWRWIKEPPCKIEKLDEGEGRVVTLNDEEIDALIEAAIADQDGDVWLFILYGLNTSMRHREILKSRFDQIDWERRRQHIQEAKAGARWQPLTSELIDILKNEREMREDQDGWIFPAKSSTAKHPYRDRVSRGFKRAVERAGLDPSKITPHVMRHTAATRLIEGGADMITAAKVTGHKTPRML